MEADGPLAEAVSRFGAALKAKLSGKGVAGAPENQLRAPLEALLADLAAILLFGPVTAKLCASAIRDQHHGTAAAIAA